jgi:hypothetical protein
MSGRILDLCKTVKASVLVQFEKRRRRWLNSSPGFERSENPGSQEQVEQTLKALGLCDINPYRVESMTVAVFPGLALARQPWAGISQRLRRFSN